MVTFLFLAGRPINCASYTESRTVLLLWKMERAPKLWMMMRMMMCGKETNWINRKVVASYHKSEWDIQIISNIPDVQRFWIFYVFAKGMAMWTQYLCIRWRKIPKLIKSLICVYNKLASSKMRKLKSWQAYKLTN